MSLSRPGSENRAFLVFVALAVVATIGIIVWLRPEPAGRGDGDGGPTTAQESPPADTGPLRGPDRKEKRPKKQRKADSIDLSTVSLPGLGTPQGGLDGTGDSASMTPHRMTVRLTSSGPIGYIAMVIPTDAKNNRRQENVAGSSWSLSTTVYGRPDYIAIFAQGGYDGRQVHCTVTIDGRVTERRSTKGPYGTIWCQG